MGELAPMQPRAFARTAPLRQGEIILKPNIATAHARLRRAKSLKKHTNRRASDLGCGWRESRFVRGRTHSAGKWAAIGA